MSDSIIAENLIKEGLSASKIIEITGLTPTELEQITVEMQKPDGEFKPRIIYIDTRHIELAREYVEQVCPKANELLSELSTYFDTTFSLSDFLEFLYSKNTNEWILTKWVILKNISFAGLSIEKLIKSNLIDIPEHAHLNQLQSDLLNAIAKPRSSFSGYMFDVFTHGKSQLIQMWNQNKFELSQSLSEHIDNKFTTYTKNEVQNNYLALVKELIYALNNVASSGFIKSMNHGMSLIEIIANFNQAIDSKGCFIHDTKQARYSLKNILGYFE